MKTSLCLGTARVEVDVDMYLCNIIVASRKKPRVSKLVLFSFGGGLRYFLVIICACVPVLASQRKLIVPCYRLNSFDHRCFAVVGLSTWNSPLRDPALSLNVFMYQLMTHSLQNIDDEYSAH